MCMRACMCVCVCMCVCPCMHVRACVAHCVLSTMNPTCLQSFPHLPVYRLHMGPIGPHTTGMFEVDISTPHDFGQVVPWLSLNRGNLSVLVHSINAMWMGEERPVDIDLLKRLIAQAGRR